MSSDNEDRALADLATTDRPRLPGRTMVIRNMDGTEHRVRILNKDKVAWDKTRSKHKWEAAQDAPFLAGNFLAFCAAKREGIFDGTFDAFVEWAGDVEDDTSEEDELGADPTRTAQAPGSA